MAGRKPSVSTGMLPYTWQRGDKHPTMPDRTFVAYVKASGRLYEHWSTEEQAERLREKGRLRDRNRTRAKSTRIDYNTGSVRGHYKMWTPHPTYAGMFFIQYVNSKDGIKEVWGSQAQKDKHLINACAQAARRRGDYAYNDTSEADKRRIRNIYAIRNIKNNAHGTTVYHIDHIIPLAKGGTHSHQNLQLATAKWNQSKGSKLF